MLSWLVLQKVYVGLIGLAFGLLPSALISQSIRLYELDSQGIYIARRGVSHRDRLHFENIDSVIELLSAKMHLSDRLHAIYHLGEHLVLLLLLFKLTILFFQLIVVKTIDFLEIVLHNVHRLGGLPEESVISLVTEVGQCLGAQFKVQLVPHCVHLTVQEG